MRASATAPGSGDVVFVAGCTLVFGAAAVATVRLCAPMVGGMGMPGGWTLSMAWMRMPGQGWAGAWAMFAGTWAVMMVAMMLPAIAPSLRRYGGEIGGARGLVAGAGMRGLVRAPGVRTLIAGAGYFAVWASIGVVVYPVGALLADATTRSAGLARVVPIAFAAVLLMAGALQLTRWKARQLERCRVEPVGGGRARATPSPGGLPCCVPPTTSPARPASGPGAAFRAGLRLGGHCALCCTGLMATLLVLGAMDVRAMAAIGAAITGERLLPWYGAIARTVGVVLVGLGLVVGARVVGIG